MRLALDQAEEARRINEVPVGCVIVDSKNSILSKSYNLREQNQDPTAHAEILAIKKAAEKTGSWRLDDATLYVTLEPCVMCMGAIVNSRISRVIFGARDEKAGALVSNFGIGLSGKLNHSIKYKEGILGKDCGEILTEFFTELRKKNNEA